jgi:hypothetical protein
MPLTIEENIKPRGHLFKNDWRFQDQQVLGFQPANFLVEMKNPEGHWCDQAVDPPNGVISDQL